MNRIGYISQIALVCLLPVYAQSPNSGAAKDPNQKQHAAAAIFDEIMQTLPADMKAKVDSASVTVKDDSKSSGRNGSGTAAAHSSRSGPQSGDRDAAVQQLPQDVRAKVEKAISDIDLMNQDRQIQFKDYEKNHQGGK
jgi:hypothetical protein